MMESISSVYSTPFSPDAEMILRTCDKTADYSFDLVHSFMASYALIGTSKSLAGPALAAISEARRLDVEDAPRLESARNVKEAEDAKSALEKMRTGNKGAFQP